MLSLSNIQKVYRYTAYVAILISLVVMVAFYNSQTLTEVLTNILIMNGGFHFLYHASYYALMSQSLRMKKSLIPNLSQRYLILVAYGEITFFLFVIIKIVVQFFSQLDYSQLPAVLPAMGGVLGAAKALPGLSKKN